jgi:hypothetical protein
MGSVRTVILVPRRADYGDRDELWDWCREWWTENLDLPIFEGHHLDGLFNRSMAVNTAARMAEDWDVAVIIDADVIIDPDRVREAIKLAASSGQMVLPYQIRRDLSNPGSALVREGGKPNPLHVNRRYRGLVSSVVVVPRRLWDQVGGFDEHFRGWGAEDDAFAAACRTFGGDIQRLDGDVWHLFHPTIPGQGKHSPSYAANAARWHRYKRATGNKAAILALAREPSPTIAPTTDTIPRILHRVVPERIDERAEMWWAQFADLHPGWQMMTHRDPLDPEEWPLTAEHWPRVANGAQFADIVRLEVLLRWGGVYVDEDVQPVRSLEPLIHVPAFAAWENNRTVPNAVLGAVPDHPAIRECLDMTLSRLKGKVTRPREVWQAGPGVTTAVLPGRSDVLILGPGAFYPVAYDAEDKATALDELRPEPWTFVIHHYWGSWLPKAKPPKVPLPSRRTLDTSRVRRVARLAG